MVLSTISAHIAFVRAICVAPLDCPAGRLQRVGVSRHEAMRLICMKSMPTGWRYTAPRRRDGSGYPISPRRRRDAAQHPVAVGVRSAVPRDHLQKKDRRTVPMATMASQYEVVELT